MGYHLTLVKSENCNQTAVTSLVLNYVPSAQVLSSVGAELEFVLSSEHGNAFQGLFLEIESKSNCALDELILRLRVRVFRKPLNVFHFYYQTVGKMKEYGITSFGVSVTTLEEVFMKVGEGSEKTVDVL